MAYTVNLPAEGAVHTAATPASAKAYARNKGAQLLEDVDKFINTVWDRSKKMGIRPEIPYGQWCDETDVGKSEYWVKNRNPGGLRITYPGEPSKTWASGHEAALGMLHRLSLYIYGKEHAAIKDGRPHDPLADEVGKAGYLGIVDVLNDLSGRWAQNPAYGQQIKDHLNAAFPKGDDKGGAVADPVLTFGKVPHPAYQNRQIWKTEGVGMNNLGKRTVKGVSWHRILGSLWGTDGFFRDPSVGALTDYGVGVTAQDGAAHDGEILRWNDPLGYQSGWASGTYSEQHAYGDGAAFVNKYGVNAINRDRASIEISGFQTTALSPKAKEAIAGITAYWADQARIPWQVFPTVPEDGFSFVVWHEEFGPDLGQKKCPFQVVKDATPELIEMTAQIMKKYQEEPYTEVPPPAKEYAAPVTYPWLAQPDGKVHNVKGTKILPLTMKYTTQKKTPRYQKGTKTGPTVGPDIPKGTTFHANWCFRSSEGIAFVITDFGTRVLAGALLPRIGVTESGRISVRYDGVGAPDEIIEPQAKETP